MKNLKKNPVKTRVSGKKNQKLSTRTLSEIKIILAEMFQDWEFKDQEPAHTHSLATDPIKQI